MDHVLAVLGEPDEIRSNKVEGTVWVYIEVRGLNQICLDDELYEDVSCEVLFHDDEKVVTEQKMVKTEWLDVKSFKGVR